MDYDQNSIESVWDNILELKKVIKQKTFQEENIVVFHSGGKMHLEDGVQEDEILRFKLNRSSKGKFLSDYISWEYSSKLESRPFGLFIKLYLPYIFLPIAAELLNRAILISHFAQTLDGKIATNSGSSKWIGNEENLMHAHRMRALCEGIIVGRQTLLSDKPRLNVRHCAGDDPKKIIVGRNNCKEEISDILGDNFIEVSTKKTTADCDNSIAMESFDGSKILEELYKKGIQSVYLEGGSKTTSAFLKCSGLDQIQLHISPIILGSGVSNFSLPDINDISEGKHFTNFEFVPVGNSVMFLGNQISQS